MSFSASSRSIMLGLALAGLAVGCGPSVPEPAAPDELAATLDAYVEPLLADHDLSGVILIGTNDEVRYVRAFGKADDGSNTANAQTMRFGIASLTKTLTAGATLIAQDRGMLDLDDSLDRFGLDFPRASDITVRHLLLHSSGLGNPDSSGAFDGGIELSQLIASIAAQPLQFEPGSEHRYSNAGYNMLAWVLEQASGETYDAFLGQHVLGPLGMHATGHVTPDTPGLAVGHIPAPGPAWRLRAPSSDPSYSFGSGSLYASAPDLLLWARAIGSERLFTWREREWPYGWGRVETAGQAGIEQTGATTGFMSCLLVYPDAGLYVVVLLNQEFGGWVPLGRDLAAIALGESREPRETLQPVALSAADRTRLVGRFAAGDRGNEIVDRDGHLWLLTDGWPIGKYLTPLAPTEFAIRSDIGRIRFDDAGGGKFGRLRWDFGDSELVYRREE